MSHRTPSPETRGRPGPAGLLSILALLLALGSGCAPTLTLSLDDDDTATDDDDDLTPSGDDDDLTPSGDDDDLTPSGDDDDTTETGADPSLGDGPTGSISCDEFSFDIYSFEGSGDDVFEVDTVSAEGTFDPWAFTAGTLMTAEFDEKLTLNSGDDDFACTFPPPKYECPRIESHTTGLTYLYVGAYGDSDGNCNNSRVGDYGIHSNTALTLEADDQVLIDLGGDEDDDDDDDDDGDDDDSASQSPRRAGPAVAK